MPSFTVGFTTPARVGWDAPIEYPEPIFGVYFEWTEFRDLEEDELDGIHDSAMAILWHSKDEYYPWRYESIPHFNDAKRTTRSDVLKVLDFCGTIASAEAWGMV